MGALRARFTEADGPASKTPALRLGGGPIGGAEADLVAQRTPLEVRRRRALHPPTLFYTPPPYLTPPYLILHPPTLSCTPLTSERALRCGAQRAMASHRGRPRSACPPPSLLLPLPVSLLYNPSLPPPGAGPCARTRLSGASTRARGRRGSA